MTTPEERFKAVGDAMLKTFLERDVEAALSLWADGCTRTAIDPFGDHHVIRGKEALRETMGGWAEGFKSLQVLKNEFLCADEEKGISNAIVTWTTQDGREASCDFIYVIMLDENDQITAYTEWNVVSAREVPTPEEG